MMKNLSPPSFVSTSRSSVDARKHGCTKLSLGSHISEGLMTTTIQMCFVKQSFLEVSNILFVAHDERDSSKSKRINIE